MIRTKPRGRRARPVAAAVVAGALVSVGGVAPSASARPVDYTVCQSSDTRVFVTNVAGDVQVTSRYWNGSQTPSVVVLDPASVQWSFDRANRRIVVTATDDLVALGGFKYEWNPQTQLVEDSNINWNRTVRLKLPAVGTSYMLCGDDTTRVSTPWPY